MMLGTWAHNSTWLQGHVSLINPATQLPCPAIGVMAQVNQHKASAMERMKVKA